MKNIDAAGRGRSVTADQPIGKDRKCRVQTAGNYVIKGNDVIIIDGDGAGENKAVVIVPRQSDGFCR